MPFTVLSPNKTAQVLIHFPIYFLAFLMVLLDRVKFLAIVSVQQQHYYMEVAKCFYMIITFAIS